jgi:hypothetical protein
LRRLRSSKLGFARGGVYQESQSGENSYDSKTQHGRFIPICAAANKNYYDSYAQNHSDRANRVRRIAVQVKSPHFSHP